MPATFTKAQIIAKLDAIELRIEEGVSSTELDTGQTKTKVVYNLKQSRYMLELWKGRLKRDYPIEYRKRYGATMISVYTNRGLL